MYKQGNTASHETANFDTERGIEIWGRIMSAEQLSSVANKFPFVALYRCHIIQDHENTRFEISGKVISFSNCEFDNQTTMFLSADQVTMNHPKFLGSDELHVEARTLFVSGAKATLDYDSVVEHLTVIEDESFMWEWAKIARFTRDSYELSKQSSTMPYHIMDLTMVYGEGEMQTCNIRVSNPNQPTILVDKVLYTFSHIRRMSLYDKEGFDEKFAGRADVVRRALIIIERALEA